MGEIQDRKQWRVTPNRRSAETQDHRAISGCYESSQERTAKPIQRRPRGGGGGRWFLKTHPPWTLQSSRTSYVA